MKNGQSNISINNIFRIPIINKLNSIPTYSISRLDGSKKFELDQQQLLIGNFNSLRKSFGRDFGMVLLQSTSAVRRYVPILILRYLK